MTQGKNIDGGWLDELDLWKRVEARREDPEFQARLRRIMTEQRTVLERLADH